MLGFWETAGTLGSFLIIGAYFSNQQGWVESRTLPYLALNLIGSLLITLSLLESWNLPSLVIEVFWMLISGYGIVRLFWKTAER
jgi:hypothetical protein